LTDKPGLAPLRGNSRPIQMINLRPAPVVRVLIPYAFGSVAGYTGFMEVGPLLLFILSTSIWLVAILVYRFSREWRRIFHLGFCLSVLALFFIMGLGIGRIDRPQDPGIPTDENVVIKGRVEDEPVMRNGKLVFGVAVRMAYTHDSVFLARNLLKIYMQLQTGSACPEVGETWLLIGRLVPIENAGNPGEVDYASILKRKNCWYNFYCDTTDGQNRMVLEHDPGIPGPGELRRSLSGYWEGAPETIALLKAVCLGDRSGLSAELRQSYSMAGGMHVLAVSGLHVGLIWWVLNQLSSFIVLRGKREIFRVALITLILWSFAYVTGFSSSVSRSVTMFTFYSLSRIMNHRGHPVNAILVSMFMLILIHPGRLLDVGFQLSYAAILSIVTLNPVILGIWKPRNRLIRWIWEATGISIAAQIGTLPLVILYFHQLPVYALLTNLVAVPLLSCIITIFVISSPMTVTGFGAGIASSLLTTCGGIMNALMEVIASFPGAVLGGLFIDPFTTVMLMILIFLLILFLNRRERLPLYLSVLVLCILTTWMAGNRNTRLRTGETWISHFRGGSLITIREGLKVDHYIQADDYRAVAYMDRYISTAWGRRCYETSVVRIGEEGVGDRVPGGVSCAVRICPGAILVGNNKIRALVVSGLYDRDGLDIPGGLKPDFVLLSGEPFRNQVEALSSFPNMVVDGSNRKWYPRKLRETGLRIYDTAICGAFVVYH